MTDDIWIENYIWIKDVIGTTDDIWIENLWK